MAQLSSARSYVSCAPLGLLAEQVLARDFGIKVVRQGLVHEGKHHCVELRPLHALYRPEFEFNIPLEAAIAPTTSNPAALTGEGQNNSVSIDATGADYLLVNQGGINGSFVGIANRLSSGPTYNGNAGTSLIHITGGTGAESGSFYGWNDAQLPASTATLVINYTDSSFAGGPKIGYCFFSGVNQGSGPADAVRSTGQDNSLGTSVSIALTTAAGDHCVWAIGDLSDSTHTPSGSCSEDYESTTNSWTLTWGHFTATGTSTTGGWTAGTNCSGLGIALIPAGAGAQTITPSGVATAENFGSATVLPGAVSVVPTGIATAEAFGSAALSSVIGPSGIATLEAFGAVTVVPGVVYILPNSIASGESFGSAVVGLLNTIVDAGGIVSLEAFGTVVIIVPLTVLAEAIESLEAFGGIERVLRPGWDHYGTPTPAWSKQSAGAPGWSKQASIDVEWEE